MDTRIIKEASHAVLAGELSFPESAARLLAAGVESYRIDFANLRKTCYGGDGAVVTTAIPYENLPDIAPVFDLAALRANLLDSQQRGQKYRDFVHRAMAGGVLGYIAFLRGRRVLYWGRSGDQHVEWFPDAAPRDPAA